MTGANRSQTSSYRFALLLGVGLLAFSTGCKVGPEYVRPSTTLPVDWDVQQQSLSADQQEVVCAWWEQLNAPELNFLIDQVVTSNLSLREALHRIEEARAIERATAALARPDVSGTTLSQYRQFSKNGNAFIPNGTAFQLTSMGFDSSWEIDLWGKLKRLSQAAIADRYAVTEAYNGLVVSLCAETAKTFVELRTLQARLAIAERNLAIQAESVKLADTRNQAGLVTYLDVAQGVSEYHVTEAAIPLLRQQLQQTGLRLCVLQGYAPTLQLLEQVGAGPIPDVPKGLNFGVPQDLLRRRPDIRKAEQEMIRECERIGVATADLYPQLNLTGTISVDSREIPSLFTADSLAHNIGPSFRWNFLSMGRIRNKIAAQDAKFKQSVDRYREQVLVAAEETLGAMISLNEERERVLALQQATMSSQQAVDLAMEQYRTGLVNFQSVLDSQRQMLLTEETLASSRGQVVLNMIRTYKAIGGGWQCPVVHESVEEGKTVEERKTAEEVAPVEAIQPVEEVPP